MQGKLSNQKEIEKRTERIPVGGVLVANQQLPPGINASTKGKRVRGKNKSKNAQQVQPPKEIVQKPDSGNLLENNKKDVNQQVVVKIPSATDFQTLIYEMEGFVLHSNIPTLKTLSRRAALTFPAVGNTTTTNTSTSTITTTTTTTTPSTSSSLFSYPPSSYFVSDSGLSPREILNKYYHKFPDLVKYWVGEVLRDYYNIHDLIFVYSGLAAVRTAISWGELYNRIENFEIHTWARSRKCHAEIGDEKKLSERIEQLLSFVEKQKQYMSSRESSSTTSSSISPPRDNVKLQPAIINVWKWYSFFMLEPRSQDDHDSVFYFSKNDKPPYRPPHDCTEGRHSVSTKKDFLRKFHLFTNNQFKGWRNWSNMVVMGGSVVASLLPLPPKFNEDDESTRKFYHDLAYPESDIDVYFYGLSTKQFIKKLIDFYQYLHSHHNGEILAVKTTNTITFSTKYPSRHIQVVLGKWNSIAELLVEPDIDCTCVAFDGMNVWATQRARLSFNFRRITISIRNLSLRGSPDYEKRLVKYSRRGFYIYDPIFEWDKVSWKYLQLGRERLMTRSWNRMGVSGLRLLLCGFKYPEVRSKLPAFQFPSWKDHGLPYGPNWNVYSTEQKLEEPIYVNTNYGPTQLASPYEILQKFGSAIHTIKLFDDTGARMWQHWYDYVFFSDELIENNSDDRVERLPYFAEYKDGYFLFIENNSWAERKISEGYYVGLVKGDFRDITSWNGSKILLFKERHTKNIDKLLAEVSRKGKNRRNTLEFYYTYSTFDKSSYKKK